MNNCGIFLLIICGCYSIGGITQKCNFPLFSGVWTAAFAWQSALFALATIRPRDEVLYASRPYHRSPLQGTHGDRAAGDNSTRLTQSVTIAIPSLRSLRSRHNQRHFSYCATSLCAPATQQHGAVACTFRQVRRSICSPPLRLVFRLRNYTFLLQAKSASVRDIISSAKNLSLR